MSPRENLEHCLELASSLASPDLVVLPELANTGYGFETRRELREVCEEIPAGPGVRILQAASERMKCAIVAGLGEKDGPFLHDSAVVLDSGMFVGRYRKMHLYARENLFFEPGRDRALVYQLQKFRLAVQICLVLGFPDELLRLSRLGAQIVAHPANLSLGGTVPPKTNRVEGNGAWVASSNRVGQERVYSAETTFTGQSLVLSPDSRIIALASPNREEAIEVEIDLNEVKHLAARGRA